SAPPNARCSKPPPAPTTPISASAAAASTTPRPQTPASPASAATASTPLSPDPPRHPQPPLGIHSRPPSPCASPCHPERSEGSLSRAGLRRLICHDAPIAPPPPFLVAEPVSHQRL